MNPVSFSLLAIFCAALLAVPFAARAEQNPDGQTIIVLDPGHGGEDDGAVGHRDFREKDIVLNFTLRLREQILRENPDFKIYLTRQQDEAVSPAQRIAMARRLKADLFLSIHADWSADPSVQGFAVYSPESGAAWRYNPEKPDRHMQASLPAQGTPDAVKAILHDLIARESRHRSGVYAQTILASAREHTQLLDRAHRLARFRVLTAPDVPAVLLELGFLTNQQDADNLVRARWQIALARQIATAVGEALTRPPEDALY